MILSPSLSPVARFFWALLTAVSLVLHFLPYPIWCSRFFCPRGPPSPHFLGSGSFSASAGVSASLIYSQVSAARELCGRTFGAPGWTFPLLQVFLPTHTQPQSKPALLSLVPAAAWKPCPPVLHSSPRPKPSSPSFFEPPTVSAQAFSLLPFLLGPDILYPLLILCLSSPGTPVCQLICACLSLTPFTDRCTTHRNIHTHTHRYLYSHEYTYIHPHPHVCTDYINTDKHTQIHTYIITQRNISLCPNTHTHIYRHIHTNIHILIHTQTRRCTHRYNEHPSPWAGFGEHPFS